jgi:hypothetical protein
VTPAFISSGAVAFWLTVAVLRDLFSQLANPRISGIASPFLAANSIFDLEGPCRAFTHSVIESNVLILSVFEEYEQL